MIRSEVWDAAVRWREVLVGLGLAGLGLWLVAAGGYVLPPAGAVVLVLGAGWAVLAWRRLRFDQGPDGPGLVEIIEGQVGYLGPTAGGFVSLDEMTELRLLALRGRRVWRLKQADGQALLIPVDAAGAEGLFDAFASLPGLTSAELLAALEGAAPQGGQALTLAASSRLVWARDRQAVIAR